MPLYYVTTTGTLPQSYADQGYQILDYDGSSITVSDNSTYTLAPDLTGDINFIPPSDGVGDPNHPFEVRVDESNPNLTGIDTDTVAFRGNLIATLSVADNVDISGATVWFDDTDGATIEIGSGSQIGDINGPTENGESLNLNVGDNSTVGDITTGAAGFVPIVNVYFETGGSDSLVFGENVTVGNVTTYNGNDSIELGDGSTIGTLSMGDGQDAVTTGENASVDGSISMGTDLALNDDDSVSLGTGSTVDGFINTHTGDDTVEIGDSVTLNGSSNAINTYIGTDQVIVGRDVNIANPIYTSTGQDTVTIAYGSDSTALAQALEDQGFTDDDGDGVYNNGIGGDDFTWNGVTYNNVERITGVPCFTTGTLILTERGEVAIEELQAGDMVETKDEGLQEIRWIGSRALSAGELAANPNLRPIRIKAGALGNGTPVADLVVSPQHRVLVRSAIAQRLFGAEEVLVAAKQLLLVEGIDIATDVAEVEYFHFLFDDHQVVISNGAETESLYTGPQALKSVGPAALEEIFTIFPELRDREEGFRPEGARTLLSGRQGRKLAQRHAEKRRALVG